MTALRLAARPALAPLILAGGVIGDRFRRHHVLTAVDLAAGGAWLAIGTCLATGRAPLPVLCLLALLAGTAHFVFLPVVRGIVADLLPPERRHAGNALVGQTEAGGPEGAAIVIGTGVLLTTAAVLTGLLITTRADGSPAESEANTVSAS